MLGFFNERKLVIETRKAVFSQPDVLQLQEVGDFYHKCSYEERMFLPPQNCHTKH